MKPQPYNNFLQDTKNKLHNFHRRADATKAQNGVIASVTPLRRAILRDMLVNSTDGRCFSRYTSTLKRVCKMFMSMVA